MLEPKERRTTFAIGESSITIAATTNIDIVITPTTPTCRGITPRSH
ncbi:MAG: hypothetical protein R2697_00500 [Ilumatobacteraceae bacterium]